MRIIFYETDNHDVEYIDQQGVRQLGELAIDIGKTGQASEEKTVKVTQVRSTIGKLPKHRATMKGLGLRKIGHTVELEDTPAVRGMINQVQYMLKVEG